MLRRKPKQSNAPRGRLAQPVPRNTSPVYSYRASRFVRNGGGAERLTSEDQDNLAHKRVQRQKLQRLRPVLLGLLVVALLGLMLRLDSTPRILMATQPTATERIFLHDSQAYVSAAHAAFATPLNSNKVTVNTKAIEQRLHQQFPELETITVALPVLGSRPAVYIQPSLPKLMLVTTDNQLFLLDHNGRAMLNANQLPKASDLHVPVVNDESGVQVKPGQVVLPEASVAFIDEITAQLHAKGIKITNMTLPAGTADVYVKIDGAGYYIKFNLHGDAREEVGTLLATKAKLDATHKAPAEYIDVRVENKVYYK